MSAQEREDKSENNRRYRVMALSALAALWLTACGGGGGGGLSGDQLAGGGGIVPLPAPGPAPAPVPTPAPAPGPAPAPAPAPAAVQVNSNITAQANTNYEVRGTGTATIDIVLPSDPAGFVSVRGVGTNPWRIVPGWAPRTTARSPLIPFTLSTVNLAGNAPAGQNWTPRLAPRQWHWIASDSLGSVLVAADIPGNLWLSLDAGATWSPTNSPSGQAWVSVAMNRTPSASDPNGIDSLQLVAAAFDGGLYRYSGGSWTQITSTTPGVDLNNREWESINVDPGGGFVAAVLNAPIYYSDGANIGIATAEGSTAPLVRGWRALAGRSVAASQDGEVWVSNTGGKTWVQRNVTIGGVQVVEQWYRVACSSDCNTIAVAGRFNADMYISRDRGLTWTRAATPTGDYTAVAMSSDAQVIAATITNGADGATRGSVQISRDGGATFAPLTLPGTDTNWRAVAMSADANMLVVAAGTFGVATGQLYTSLGNRTSYPDANGSINGAQGGYVEVEYLGNYRYSVRTSSGGPFTIQ